MAWRIYYEDGSVFRSGKHEPSEVPTVGVQVVAEIRGQQRLQHSINDFYCWDGAKWYAGSTPAETVCLAGSMIDPDDFKSIRKRAIAWLSRSN